jgi:hypothetical protein
MVKTSVVTTSKVISVEAMGALVQYGGDAHRKLIVC